MYEPNQSGLPMYEPNQSGPPMYDQSGPPMYQPHQSGVPIYAPNQSGLPMYEPEYEEPAQDDAEPAPEIECGSCLGALLNGGAGCVPNFVPGGPHFKNKFCDNCRAPDNFIVVPLARARALSAAQAACFVNKRSKGFWNPAPSSMGGGQCRIINNTAGCIGPWLALFRFQPPELQW